MNLLGISAQAWFPVITLIIGAALKALFDMASDNRVATREREARRDQRLETTRLGRNEFQRSTLLELQTVVSQLVRFTGQTNFQDTMAFRQSGHWRKQLLTEDVNEGFTKGQVEAGRLRVRVRDEATRELASKLSTACAAVALATSEGQSDRAMLEVSDIANTLGERIGLVLRSLDEDEDRLIGNTL